MKDIDVWELAEKVQHTMEVERQKELVDFAESVSGKTYSQSELVMKIISPLIGIVNSQNKRFTVLLVQEVLESLKKEDPQ